MVFAFNAKGFVKNICWNSKKYKRSKLGKRSKLSKFPVSLCFLPKAAEIVVLSGEKFGKNDGKQNKKQRFCVIPFLTGNPSSGRHFENSKSGHGQLEFFRFSKVLTEFSHFISLYQPQWDQKNSRFEYLFVNPFKLFIFIPLLPKIHILDIAGSIPPKDTS